MKKLKIGFFGKFDNCFCRIRRSHYRYSLGIILNESPPEVEARFKNLEIRLSELAGKEIKLIKNNIVWVRYYNPEDEDAPMIRHADFTGDVTIKFHHIHFGKDSTHVYAMVEGITPQDVEEILLFKPSAEDSFEQLKNENIV